MNWRRLFTPATRLCETHARLATEDYYIPDAENCFICTNNVRNLISKKALMKHRLREKRNAIRVRKLRYKAHVRQLTVTAVRKKARPFLESLLIHTALITALVFATHTHRANGGNSKAPGEQHAGTDAENAGKTIVDKPPPVTMVEVEPKTPGISKPKYIERDCTDGHWYGGVGVTSGYDYTNNRVVAMEVHAGYPAARMGLRVGDVLLNEGDLTGPPGTDVVIRAVRAGQLLTFTGIREKICYEGT